jgi:hypothetical protein
MVVRAVDGMPALDGGLKPFYQKGFAARQHYQKKIKSSYR